ncbi:hypothetical protein JMJ35_004176 [Cladonia borealis]|uniref:Zn(2)-C6 fungal-type domain-containing protein n=1 Tax=Cladonia borealis TaxID=184061 RepID=A0AA39R1Q3_9LECA|nr:hypothetical protein JMJ35_004176 [Cladonia borealis]
MPRSKVQSASDDSLGEGRECDGTNPCTRCKNDDAICAYGKHRKSDKTVFRRGYVQMLERQHTELIAGLQELYRRIQAREPFPSHPLEPAYNGQPLTHKILEALGVLPSDEEWEDGDKSVPFEGMTWQGLEQDGYAYDVSTATTSPIAQTPFSPITMTPFPQSTIMAKRARKLQDSACIINDNDANNNKNHNHEKFVGKDAVLSMPPTLNTNVPPTYQNHDISSAPFHVMQQQQPQQQQHHHRQQPQVQQQQQPLHYYNNAADSSGYESMDWIFGCNEDLFNDTQGLVAQLA